MNSSQHFLYFLKSKIIKHPSSEIILIGEFNAHHVEWLGSSRTTPRGVQPHDFAVLCSLQQSIQHPILVFLIAMITNLTS